MHDELWHIRVGEKQVGPAKSDDLIRLVKRGLLAPDMEVRCSRDNRWMRADDVPGLFSGPSQSSSVPPLPTIDAPQSIAASPSPKKAPPVKWRWAKIGGVIGLILGVVEILLVRQGKTGETDVNVVIGYMTGFFAGTTLSGAFLGFIAGVLRDYFSSRSLVEAPVAERPVERQQTPQGNKWNVISKHWRGLYPLWFSYWVINSVGGVFTAVVAVLITYLFEQKSDYDPLAIFAADKPVREKSRIGDAGVRHLVLCELTTWRLSQTGNFPSCLGAFHIARASVCD